MAKKEILISDIPDDSRPYEKFFKFGCGALSDSELLAVVLRTGTKSTGVTVLAEQILKSQGGSGGLSSLSDVSFEGLKSIRGVGPVKAAQVVCIGEIARRIAKSSAREKLDFSEPATVADFYMEDMRHLKSETLKEVFLDSKCAFLGDKTVFTGTINRSILAPRELFKEALERNAAGIIILHNHPSGDPSPSRDDILSTERIVQAGRIMGIPLFDHIIIGDRKFVSLKSTGVIG